MKTLGMLVGVFASQLAHADIYTWTDSSGRTNVSNVAPPADAHVTKVIREDPASRMRDEAARNAAREREMTTRQTEVGALSERVAQLEQEVSFARATPLIPYPTMPPPPMMPYSFAVARPPVQSVEAGPPATLGCNASWIDCGLTWSPFVYPASVIVVRNAGVNRFHPIYKTRPTAMRPSMHGSRGGRGR